MVEHIKTYTLWDVQKRERIALAVGALIGIGFATFYNSFHHKRIPVIFSEAEKDFVHPGHLEILVKDGNNNGEKETILRVDDREYALVYIPNPDVYQVTPEVKCLDTDTCDKTPKLVPYKIETTPPKIVLGEK